MPTLEELLASPEFQGRYAALKQMEKNPSPEHVGHLRRMLKDSESGLRKGAALLLATLGAEEAVDEIALLLDDSYHGCRIGGIQSLTKLGRREFLPRIATMIQDPNLRVKAAAMESLVASKDPDQAVHLLPLLEIPDDHLQVQAAEALCTLAGGRYLASIVPLLQSQAERVPERILDLVCRHGLDAFEHALLPLTTSPDPDLRAKSTFTLAPRHPDVYVPRLIEWLTQQPSTSCTFPSRDISDRNRVAALRTLSSLRRSDAAPAMAKLLGQENQDLAGWAALHLARLHLPEYGDAIRERARGGREDRQLAFEIALLRLGLVPPILRPRLLDAVESWFEGNYFGCLLQGTELTLKHEMIDALFDLHSPTVYRILSEQRLLKRDVGSVADLQQEVEAAGILWSRGGEAVPCEGHVEKGRRVSLFDLVDLLKCELKFAPRAAGVTLIESIGELGWWRSKLHSEKSSA
jgi:HEAT repeat protein